jgi:hypothetical protein
MGSIPGGPTDLLLLHNVQAGSSISLIMITKVCILWVKAIVAWS